METSGGQETDRLKQGRGSYLVSSAVDYDEHYDRQMTNLPEFASVVETMNRQPPEWVNVHSLECGIELNFSPDLIWEDLPKKAIEYNDKISLFAGDIGGRGFACLLATQKGQHPIVWLVPDAFYGFKIMEDFVLFLAMNGVFFISRNFVWSNTDRIWSDDPTAVIDLKKDLIVITCGVTGLRSFLSLSTGALHRSKYT